MAAHLPPFLNKLNIQYPIIQAPMLGVTSPEMVAAVSNLTGLGSMPLGRLHPDKCQELIRSVKKQTSKPFSVNVFVHEIENIDSNELSEMDKQLRNIASKYAVSWEEDALEFNYPSIDRMLDVILNEEVPILSFTFGTLTSNQIERLRKSNVVILGTCTSVAEANILADLKVDAIVAQGIEAGGHRGTFLDASNPNGPSTINLVEQINAALDLPIIAAGGICDQATLSAAFKTGASAVQIGSCFVTSHESLAPDLHKQALVESQPNQMVLTNAFSGRWARGKENGFITDMKESNTEPLKYPYQNSLTATMRRNAKKQEQIELQSLWGGVNSNKAEIDSAANIFKKFVSYLE